jgi:hypothetical protein
MGRRGGDLGRLVMFLDGGRGRLLRRRFERVSLEGGFVVVDEARRSALFLVEDLEGTLGSLQ